MQGPVIDLRGYLAEGSSQAVGLANLAALRSVLDLAPEGATLRAPLPTTGTHWYVEHDGADLVGGNGTVALVEKDVRLEGAAGAKMKFGPENSTFSFEAFAVANGKELRVASLNLEGPDAPNAKIHHGITHRAGTGKIILERDATLTKWAQCLKAEGDLNVNLSVIHIHVGPRCLVQSNGLGNAMLHNGGDVFIAPGSVVDMVGGTSLNHGLYLAEHVAYDVSGAEFRNAGGYNIHSYGGAAQAPKYCRADGARFVGAPGAAAVLTNPLTATSLRGAVFANTTGEAITARNRFDAEGAQFLTANAGVNVFGGASAAIGYLRDCYIRSLLNVNVAGWRFEVRGGRTDPLGTRTAAVGVAGSILFDGTTMEKGAASAELVSATAGTVTINRNIINNGASGSSIPGVRVTNSAHVEGEENTFQDGFNGIARSSPATGAVKHRRAVAPAPIASAAALILDLNYDTYHVTGTTTIVSLFGQSASANPSTPIALDVTLIPDGAWAVGTSGNITPKSTLARTVNGAYRFVRDWRAGTVHEVGADLPPLVVRTRKTTDQQIADTSSANITNLSFPVGVNETWSFEASIVYDTTASNDLRVNITVPTGATLLWHGDGLHTSAASTGAIVNRSAVNVGATSAFYGGIRAAGAAAVPLGLTIKGTVVNGATAGTLQIRAAKNANTDTTTPADDVTIYANSDIRAEKLAA